MSDNKTTSPQNIEGTWTKEEQARHRAELRLVVCAENERRSRFALAVHGKKWMASAACLAVDPEIFFPARTDRIGQAEAIAICTQCPVRTECAEDDLCRTVSDQNGIRGGMTATERRKIIRARQEKAA